jgi:DNA repair protein SbcC/Rad50
MKILAIRTENLASLEGVNHIDFNTEPLKSAGIFAITGPTGAGKSTILDALCLALFDETPRYHKVSDKNQKTQDLSGDDLTQGDVRKIMRQGAAQAQAQVEFVATDGDHYCATWQVKRARNKATGKLQATQMGLKNISKNQDVPGKLSEIKQEIVRLLGLNFEQFTRAVLLAQGEFTAFLKAKDHDKSELLEKLTGTEIYSEISKIIFQNHQNAKQNLELLKGKTEHLPCLSAEDLAEKEREIQASQAAAKTAENHINHYSKAVQWHDDLAIKTKAVAESEQQFISAQANEKAWATEKILWQNVEQVQSAKSIWEALKGKTKAMEDKSAKQAKDLADSSTQKTKYEADLNATKSQLTESQKALETANPQLKLAREIEVKIEALQQQNSTALAAKSKLEKAQKEAQNALAASLDKTKIHEEEAKILADFFEKNESRKPVVEQKALIENQLQQADKFLVEKSKIQEDIKSIEHQLKLNQAKSSDESKLKADLEVQLKAKTEAYEALKAKMATLPQDNWAELQADFARASQTWERLYEAQKQFNLNQGHIDKHQQFLDQHQAEIKALPEQIIQLQSQEYQAQKALDLAKMASTENVQQLRQQLQPDEPCVVCGSLAHPYHENAPMTALFEHLETALDKAKKAHQQSKNRHTELHTSSKNAQTESDQLKPLQADLAQKIEQHQAQWSTFAQKEKAETMAEEERLAWLVAQAETYQNALKQQQSEANTLANLEKAIQDLQGQLGQHLSQLQLLQQAAEHAQKQHEAQQKSAQKTEVELQDIRTELDVYFPQNAWFEHWQKSPEDFMQNLNDFAQKWQENAQKLIENSKKQSEEALLAKALETQSSDLNQQVEAQNTICDDLAKNIQNQHDERKKYFEGQAADEVEQSLKTAIARAQKAFDEATAAEKISQKNHQNLLGEAKIHAEELAQWQTDLEAIKQDLQTWQSDYQQQYGHDISHETLADYLAFDTSWLENQRQKNQQLAEALANAQTLQQHAQTQWQAHQTESISEDKTACQMALDEAKVAQKTAIAQESQVKEILKIDQKNKAQLQDILLDIEQQQSLCQHWGQLNDMLGSADGKKFRTLAQSHTLDILLDYSNVQLKLLSHRYRLQRIRESLGLQIIDHDMGNELRSINSISGGESFLISLALALGLASLSSKKMQVESLFIDEGFGSLDPATLNIAMDALERLHHQGRKVGVISHVQEMTERITTQIQIHKQSHGKSVVEIRG